MDDQPISYLNNIDIPPSLGRRNSTRIIGPNSFDPTDIHRLDSPTALLNDICINGLAYFLQIMVANDDKGDPSDHRCAIFSTHDLVRIRYKASNQDLWCSISRNQYWDAPI